MTSKQRVLNALRGKPVDRPAVGPLAVHFCARHAGVSLKDYSLSATVLADSVIHYYETFKPDAVWLSSDTWITAEAMGCAVACPDPEQPIGGHGNPLVSTAADIERIAPPDVTTQARLPLMVEAMERIKQALGDEVFLVACMDQQPFSLACACMGINNMMLKVYDEPDFVAALMARCSEYVVAYGTALAAAGADMLSAGDSPAGLLGPELYRDIALPAEQQVYGKLCESTNAMLLLHICGQASAVIADMATSGAQVLEIDQQVDLAHACREAGPDIALWGNLDPVAELEQGTPESIRNAACTALETVREAGHPRFVLSSGCTLAVDTPAENLRALIEAAKNNGMNTI